MIDSPSSRAPKRPQDGISWVQKVAAVEIGFHGAPGCFRGIWIYIGGRSRSVELRGAHEGGGHASLPRAHLASFLTSTPSLLGHVCSKNNSPDGFIPFGICLIFLCPRNTEIGKKKQQFALGLGLIG